MIYLKKISLSFLTIFLFLAEISFAKEIVPASKPNDEIEESSEISEQEQQEEIVKIKVADVEDGVFTEKVILQGLNKVTAKTFELKGKVGDTITFERLVVKPLKCWKSPATETPENKALLKIYEKKLNNKEVLIFYGWMFSSSPGLSGLEHPTYDITIKECEAEAPKE